MDSPEIKSAEQADHSTTGRTVHAAGAKILQRIQSPRSNLRRLGQKSAARQPELTGLAFSGLVKAALLALENGTSSPAECSSHLPILEDYTPCMMFAYPGKISIKSNAVGRVDCRTTRKTGVAARIDRSMLTTSSRSMLEAFQLWSNEVAGRKAGLPLIKLPANPSVPSFSPKLTCCRTDMENE
jgi:hypothetical protein